MFEFHRDSRLFSYSGRRGVIFLSIRSVDQLVKPEALYGAAVILSADIDMIQVEWLPLRARRCNDTSNILFQLAMRTFIL